MSENPSRAQSPTSLMRHSPRPQTQQYRNIWHTRPHFTGALVGAAGAIPLTLLAHRYRAPLGKFISNTGNYMRRAGYNMFQALWNTPYRETPPVNHVNTENEKNYC